VVGFGCDRLSSKAMVEGAVLMGGNPNGEASFLLEDFDDVDEDEEGDGVSSSSEELSSDASFLLEDFDDVDEDEEGDGVSSSSEELSSDT